MIWYFLIGAGILLYLWMFSDCDVGYEDFDYTLFILFLFFLWPLWLFGKAAGKVARSSGWAKREK